MFSILIENKPEHSPKVIRHAYILFFQSLGFCYCLIDDTSRLYANNTFVIYALDFRIASFTDIHYCRKSYPYLLAMLKTGKTWNPTAEQLALWWQKRSRVVIDQSIK